jgi:cob(I)alamin adenosyltransferase
LKIGGYSEEKALKALKNFQIQSFGRVNFVLPKKQLEENSGLKTLGYCAINKEDKTLAKKGFQIAQKAIEMGKCDFLILDEITLALQYGLLPKKEVMVFLRKWGKRIDIVLTGRDCPKAIIVLADLVSEIQEIKHYYKKGVKQRKGIEY